MRFPPDDSDDLPVPDVQVTPNGQVLAPTPVETLNRPVMENSAKMAKMGDELKAAQAALNTAKKDRQDAITQKEELQRQLHGLQDFRQHHQSPLGSDQDRPRRLAETVGPRHKPA